MARNAVLWDTTTKRFMDSGSPPSSGGSGTDTDFDVGGGGQTVFTVSGGFTSGQKMDVWANGRMQREGSSFDFTRNASTGQVTFTYTVPKNSWVRIRLY